MFRIDMLPAEFGDALWIEYGQDAVHRILIDCGTRSVFEAVKRRIEALPVAERHFELFVVTHVDVDHIGGALELAATRLRGGRPVEMTLQKGRPEAVISAVVDRTPNAMLVMGAYGHSPIRTLIVGSTTTTMIRTVRIPVLLVR